QSLIAPGLELTDRSTRIMPESVKNNETALGIYADAFLRLDALYKDLLGRGVPYYDLVYCQLSGNTVDIVITMNARELRLFFALRTCSRAQWEIRRLADLMLTEARRAAPGIFNSFGPSCYTFGECPEGAMTCGRAAEMRKKYSAVN
ncbi:MAG: FAD-dependent thymidylate synthase, partial [Firmicutes bacterium]|nr:FAD-dependent thymidylate synthase [Bacillota bacterium]